MVSFGKELLRCLLFAAVSHGVLPEDFSCRAARIDGVEALDMGF